jgi:hypothetical protein
MSEQLKQQQLYDVSEANTKNLIWVDVYVSGTEGSAGVYASRRMTKAQLIAFLNSNLTVAWSVITGKPTTLSGYGLGGGTLNKLAKFTPDGNAIGDSQIIDDGTGIGIGTAIQSGKKVVIAETRDDSVGLLVTNTGSGSTYTQGINGVAIGSSASWRIGTRGTSSGSTDTNFGLYGESAGNATGKSIGVYGLSNLSEVENIGGKFEASSSGAGTKHSLQLIDGTESVAGRFLKNVTTSGKANWATLAISDVTSLQASLDAKSTYVPRAWVITSNPGITFSDSYDIVTITALATGLIIYNTVSAFAEGYPLMIRIKDNGTAKSLTFGSKFRGIGITLPSTTVANKTIYLGMIYNSTDDKWDVLGLNQEA